MLRFTSKIVFHSAYRVEGCVSRLGERIRRNRHSIFRSVIVGHADDRFVRILRRRPFWPPYYGFFGQWAGSGEMAILVGYCRPTWPFLILFAWMGTLFPLLILFSWRQLAEDARGLLFIVAMALFWIILFASKFRAMHDDREAILDFVKRELHAEPTTLETVTGT